MRTYNRGSLNRLQYRNRLRTRRCAVLLDPDGTDVRGRALPEPPRVALYFLERLGKYLDTDSFCVRSE
jgi:hypothetical protein